MNIAIKPTYLLCATAIALASCSNDDMPGRTDADDNRIVFRTSLPELTSRAQVITESNLPCFYVTAFDFDDNSLITGGSVMKPFFANEKIELTPGLTSFTSPNCCWPDITKESDVVTFFGFYPGMPEVPGSHLINASPVNSVDYKLTGFRVEKEIADQLDFIAAYNTGTMADNLFSGVTLNFAHKLSRIEVKARGAHKSCDIEIAGVRIGGIGVEGTFDFKPVEGAGEWSGTPTPGIVEYIYRKGDKIVTNGKNHPVAIEEAADIMGKKLSDGNYNSAMLIPSNYAKWDYANDPSNESNQMYISVLLRVTDATPTAGINPVVKQRFPYTDLSQGADALDIPRVYLAVDKTSGVVSTRVYKKESNYFTDEEYKNAYTLPASEEIKEFGWAAVPVDGNWVPGKIYTYTLDYTYGVGLLDPEVTTTSPGAGDPVISDRVGITYTVKDWNIGGGSEFEVPGS